MKTSVLLLLGLFSFSALVAAPVGDISTLTGKTYRRCEIVRVHPDGVSLTHSNGAAKILFTDLPEHWRTKLGYDPAKAVAYERELAERRQREAQARKERQEELGRALEEARQRALVQQLGIEAQARAAQQMAAQQPTQAGTLYPVLPVLGSVHDSRDYRHRTFINDQPFYPYGFNSYPYNSYGYGYHNLGWSVCPPRRAWSGSVRGRVGGVTFRVGY